MPIIRQLLPAALLLATSTAGAQQPKQPLPLKLEPTKTTPAITTADLMTRIYRFADDSMRGRMAGSPEAMKGTEYIAGELKRLGLQPAGDSGTYFQNVPFGVQTMDSSSTIQVGETTFKAGSDFIASSQLGSVVEPRRLEVIFGGQAIDTMNVLAPEKVQGKILLLRPAAGPPSDIQAFITSEGFKRYQASVSAAAMVGLIGPPQFPPAVIRNAFTPGPFVQLVPEQPSVAPVTLQLTQSAAEALLGTPNASLTKGAAGKTAEVNLKFVVTRRPGRNVAAILPGSDPKLKGEYVAIGAHSDHVGVRAQGPVEHDSMRVFNTVVRPQGADSPNRPATADEVTRVKTMLDSARAVMPPRQDSINNGADDDGSGSMGVLEIAEAFASAKQRPKRSILFVWHMGEEEGMLGSRFYTDHPTVPRDSIVAQLNVDMIGRGATSDITGEAKDGSLIHGRDSGYVQVIGSRRLSTELGNLVEDVNTKTKANLQLDYALDADGHRQNIYCRSDHYMYARYGIPIAFFTTGGHRDYHQVTDEPEYLDFDQYRRVTQFIYDVAGRVADLDHRPLVDKPKPDPNGACKQ
jgi:hypothetical protein